MPKPADKDLQQQLDDLRRENERLKAGNANQTISLKVSDKGALSMYGLGRFPVTLYQEQWHKVLAEKENILAFIEANKDKLKAKVKE